MGKFKIGDLVTMSAAGAARQQNHWVRGRMGLVMGFRTYGKWPIVVHWLPVPDPDDYPTTQIKEYELKFVSKARRA